MLTQIVDRLNRISHSLWYWLIYIVGGITLLAVALYHQYMLDELPCVLCIQIRLWVSFMIIVGLLGLIVRETGLLNSMAHLLLVLTAVGMTERSYMLLGTEKGFVFADCSFSLGLPGWFAIDKWLPAVYQIETSCGYTPELIFGITMAESLMLMSVLMLIISSGVALGSFFRMGR